MSLELNDYMLTLIKMCHVPFSAEPGAAGRARPSGAEGRAATRALGSVAFTRAAFEPERDLYRAYVYATYVYFDFQHTYGCPEIRSQA